MKIKQKFIGLAREFHRDMNSSVEKKLACALLYMNVADHLAEYLVLGHSSMIQISLQFVSKKPQIQAFFVPSRLLLEHTQEITPGPEIDIQ